jgi:hypothetical protein
MAAITRRKLRSSGVRGIPRGVHERTRENPYGLTRIGHHVSAILTKLQVRSRGEAAALAGQQGLLVTENRKRSTATWAGAVTRWRR